MMNTQRLPACDPWHPKRLASFFLSICLPRSRELRERGSAASGKVAWIGERLAADDLLFLATMLLVIEGLDAC